MPAEITPSELAAKMKSGEPVYLLDVRLPAEQALASLPGSTLIPLQELNTRWPEIQPGDATLVIYCHHGVRSMYAAYFLEQQGFHNILSLQGGIDAWSVEVDANVARY